MQGAFLTEMLSGLFPSMAVLAEVPRYGSWVIAAGGLVAFVNLAASLRGGARAPANPWGAAGLTWTTLSPPPVDNFLDEPDENVEEARGDRVRPATAPSRLPG